MNHIDFFEAMRAAFDLEGIIKVLFTVFRAYYLDEIDDDAVRPLLMLAFHRNNLFQQSILRQRGTRTSKEEAAERHAVWQEEANKIWAEHPRWSNTDVGNQVRINLNRKKKRSCKAKGPYIGRIIKKPL
jgi:hypothetical protein